MTNHGIFKDSEITKTEVTKSYLEQITGYLKL